MNRSAKHLRASDSDSVVPVYRRPSRRGGNGSKREVLVTSLFRVRGTYRRHQQVVPTFDCRVHGFNISAFGVARESRSRKNVDASSSRLFARPRAANQLIARQLWPFNLRGVCAAYLAKPMSPRVGRRRYGIQAMRDRMNAIAHGLNPIREGMNLAWGTVKMG